MDEYDTKLTPTEEKQFQSWKSKYAPKDSGKDYDLRGAFKSGLTPDPKTGHWPDTFKKPNHPTFSVESIYAKDRPELAGQWQGQRYIPPQKPMPDYVDALNYIYGQQVRRRRDPLSVAQRTRSARSFIPAANTGGYTLSGPLTSSPALLNRPRQDWGTPAPGPRMTRYKPDKIKIGAAMMEDGSTVDIVGPNLIRVNHADGGSSVRSVPGNAEEYLAKSPIFTTARSQFTGPSTGFSRTIGLGGAPPQGRTQYERNFNLGYYGGAGGRETGGISTGQPLPSVGNFAGIDIGSPFPLLGRLGGNLFTNSLFPALRSFGSRMTTPQRRYASSQGMSSNPYDNYPF